jgi:excisionase family DNA binding protein
MMAPVTDLIGAPEVAAILHTSLSTVKRRARTGEIPATKLPGEFGAYVFSRADIEAYRDRQAVAS